VPGAPLAPLPTLGEPWLRRPDWASGRVKDESASPSAGAQLAAGWMFVVLWFGGLVGFGLVVHVAAARPGNPDPGSSYLILGAFGLAGLLPLSFVVHAARHRSRYGGTVFVMSAVPGVIGGRLDGTIEIPAKLDRGTRVHATLTCWMRSSHAKFPDDLMWEVPALDAGVYGASPTRVPLSFEIPFECSASHPDGIRGGVYWRLRAQGGDGAPGLDAMFVVPIFVTPQSRRPEPAAAPSLAGPLSAAEAEEAAANPEPAPREAFALRYRFGPVTTLFCVVLPMVLPLALVLTWPVGAPNRSLNTAWPALMVATPLVVAFALLTHFTEVMGVEVADGQLIVRRGYGGWFGARRIPLADVRRIDLDTSVNNYKRVVARTRQRDVVGVSRWVTVMEAHRIAGEVRSAIAAAGGALDE
jgi:hypothetical protein